MSASGSWEPTPSLLHLIETLNRLFTGFVPETFPTVGKMSAERSYDPRDTALKLVSRRDDLDPMSSDGDEGLRAEMSCGHAVAPDLLAQWCRSELDKGIYEFRCPAVVEGTTLCRKLLPYQEVRKLALLTLEEMQHFEETIASLAAREYCEIQSCPQCKTYVERRDLSNLCVKCTICSADRKKAYHFCWQCHKPWKGPGPRSDRCGNDGCASKDLELLGSCVTVSLPDVRGVAACPSIRACPTCGMRVMHDRKACKNVRCPRCQAVFCFVCLQLKSECIKTSLPYEICRSGVAPRQTSLPVWPRR